MPLAIVQKALEAPVLVKTVVHIELLYGFFDLSCLNLRSIQ